MRSIHKNQAKYKKTISWDKSTNTAFIRSASSYKKLHQLSKNFADGIGQEQKNFEKPFICNAARVDSMDNIYDRNLKF